MNHVRNESYGLIFDMDGVIINTCDLHEESWKHLSTVYGFPWDTTLNFKKDVFGTCSVDSATILFKHHISGYDMKKICLDKEEIYHSLLLDQVKNIVVPGFMDFFKEADQLNISLALATSSTEQEAKFVLKSLGIYDQFKVIMNISNVRNPKPHPEIYLKASEALGIDPEYCIGFEDSISGITALDRAGIPCVVVGTTLSYDKLISTETAFRVYIRDFDEITAQDILRMFKEEVSVAVSADLAHHF